MTLMTANQSPVTKTAVLFSYQVPQLHKGTLEANIYCDSLA